MKHHLSKMNIISTVTIFNSLLLAYKLQMSRLVHVMKGQWRKMLAGVWRFEHDPAFPAHAILVGKTDHVEAVKGMVRGVFKLRAETPLLLTFHLPPWMLEPEGATSPPQNIVTNADVKMMICVHEWNTEPRLCVIFGAEDVATYQFRCRSPFAIGRRHFLGDGVTEEQHMALVLDVIRVNEILCSQSVMSEVFDEDEMVLLYRFSLEIEKAKNSLDLNLGPTVENGDHIVPTASRTWTMNRVAAPLGRMYAGNGFEVGNGSGGGQLRASDPSHAYDPTINFPSLKPWKSDLTIGKA
ncbi:uncharacterized protein LOC108821798 [Raphanus sativus]|uniref:Uncharacterized protein LOC108821798 n=1 Tax=Raphanus sativus TaxID=3726 RepID=A0A6J0KT88_RAPSA|nr:uncharacterized protein LOC108821798 [Raphanus sativus]